MTLKEAQTGDKVNVLKINLDKSVKRRFEVLGMTEGSAVSVINRKSSGTMIINIRGTRFAVGKDFAGGIECTFNKAERTGRLKGFDELVSRSEKKAAVL